MAVVTVDPRHSKKCQRNKDKSARQYKRCKCPLWLEWNENGIQFRKSAKTRTWEIANKGARKLEEELDLKAAGIEPQKKPDHISIQSAVDLYLKDMDQRGIKDRSKARRMLFGLRDCANEKNVILLKDVTARLLTEWRSSWTFKKDSDSPSVHWSVVKTFFKWAFSTDLIPADPSAKLKSLPCGRKQVCHFHATSSTEFWLQSVSAASALRRSIGSEPSSCSSVGLVFPAWTLRH